MTFAFLLISRSLKRVGTVRTTPAHDVPPALYNKSQHVRIMTFYLCFTDLFPRDARPEKHNAISKR